MKTIAFYISDYGYGHATRAIAIIRKIVAARPDIRIIAKTSGPFDLTRRSLIHPRITAIMCRNDPDVPVNHASTVVDRKQTRKNLVEWLESWDAYVSLECSFCKENNIDLIISDIAPQPFLVAEKWGIPSMAISNFSWDTIYKNLYPDIEQIRLLEDAYQEVTKAIILPFDIDMEKFPRKERVSLVSRSITRSRATMRENIGIPKDSFVIFLSGKSHAVLESLSAFAESNNNLRFILPAGLSGNGAISIPLDETESQDWIGMCDCVVTKCGYSTVSEAVHARIPLLVWKREGFIEDDAIAAKIEDLGIGKCGGCAEEGVRYCIDNRKNIEIFRKNYRTLDPIYHDNGIPSIINEISRLIS